MTAQQLLNELLNLQADGHVLSEITISFRENYDSDVIPLRHFNEDLYDETNRKLISMCLMNREDDIEDDAE